MSFDFVDWLIQETHCSRGAALVAVEHCRGNVFVARDMLYDEVARSRFEKEAREYGRD